MITHVLRRQCLVLGAVVALAGTAGASVSSDLLALTGGQRTRIVFSRWDGIGNNDTEHPIFAVMVFDTPEGDERTLVASGRTKHPLITPTGTRVILDEFTYIMDGQGVAQKAWVIDWDGTNQREIVSSGCFKTLGVAEDPRGTVWVYYLDANAVAGNVRRRQIDNPAVE